MELTSVGKVILGLLSRDDLSGYDIKLEVDESTRFFWAASYGQIYPELKRLEEEGLVEGTDTPQGGRARRVYRITEVGRRALASWITDTGSTVELRHEGLLKLFFAEVLESTEERVGVLEDIAAVHRRQVKELEAIEGGICLKDGDSVPGGQPGTPEFVLRFGLDFHRWVVGWCEREIETARESEGIAGGAGV